MQIQISLSASKSLKFPLRGPYKISDLSMYVDDLNKDGSFSSDSEDNVELADMLKKYKIGLEFEAGAGPKRGPLPIVALHGKQADLKKYLINVYCEGMDDDEVAEHISQIEKV